MSRNLRSLAFQYARASSRELAAWDSPYRARWSYRAERARRRLPAHVQTVLRPHTKVPHA
jgi:hypothetical protein